MPLQHDAFEHRASLWRQYAINWNAPDIRLSSVLKSLLVLWVVVFVGLKMCFTSSQSQKQIANFSVSLILSCTVRMMIVSWWPDIMLDVKSRGWQNLTVTCRDFGRRLRRHWLIGPLSRIKFCNWLSTHDVMD